MSLRDGVDVRLRGGIQIRAARKFRKKIEGRQSHPAGGEVGLGQGWVLGGQIPAGSLRGCASTQVNQAGGDPAKRRGGCVGRNIPAAVQAFGPLEKRLLFQVHTGRSAVW